MSSNKITEVDDVNFDEEVLQSDLPVLVDFWAAWCAPCRMIAPIVEQVADEFAGKVKVTKCNTETAYTTPAKYGVRGIPTLMLFKEGKLVDNLVGAVSKERLTAMIDNATDGK